jgi:hypothetical protein
MDRSRISGCVSDIRDEIMMYFVKEIISLRYGNPFAWERVLVYPFFW